MICKFCGGDSSLAVTARWENFLPLEPPSQNLVGNNKGTWRVRKAYAKYRDDYQLLLAHWKNRASIPDATKRRRVTLTRYYSRTGRKRGQERDRINNAGGMKPLLDAMVNVRLLVDDKPGDVEDYYDQCKVVGASGVHVLLEEVDYAG